jgi:hypothetical protein
MACAFLDFLGDKGELKDSINKLQIDYVALD